MTSAGRAQVPLVLRVDAAAGGQVATGAVLLGVRLVVGAAQVAAEASVSRGAHGVGAGGQAGGWVPKVSVEGAGPVVWGCAVKGANG
jgi:hypothetical protein